MYALFDTFAAKLLPVWVYDRLIGRWNAYGLKRYAVNTLWGLTSRIVSMLVSFLVTVYLVRYLGPENYGQLSYAVSFVGLFSIIASLGLDTVLYRDLIKHPDQRNEYLGSAFLLKLAAGIAAAILTIGFSIAFSQDDVSRLIIFILAGTFIFNAFNIIGYEFQAKVAQKYVSLVTLAVTLILNLLKVAVIVTGEGILYIGFILLLEAILYAALYIYIHLWRYGSMFAWRFDRSIAAQLLIDSWPFIFIAAFSTAYSRIDQVMLKYLLDSTAVGLYDAAVRIAEAWLFIPAIIASSLFPAIVNAKEIGVEEYQKRLMILAGVMGALGIVIALPLSFYAGPLMTLLYGAAFAGAGAAFAVYIWAGMWASLDIVVRYFLIAENRRFLIFLSSLGTAVLNIILNFYLIPRFGIVGAAWSTFLSYAVLALPLILIVRLHRETKKSAP